MMSIARSIWAEEFAYTDMIEMLKRNNCLFSLESATPMADFSFVGFYLTVELNYTTILGMLQLGQVPLWQRTGRKVSFHHGRILMLLTQSLWPIF